MKPRSDSLHSTLSSSQRDELIRVLADGAPYREALEWLDAECQVKSSLGALSNFYRTFVVPVIEERRSFAAAQATALLESAGAVDWDAATAEKLRQITFRELNRDGADIDSIKTLTTLVLKASKQAVEERKVALLEAKAKQSDAAAAVLADETQTEEDRVQKLKEIFRMG
jgi:hypothetical protein